ncbi:PorT family protein [Fibrella sp. HMF5335]|uniref:PorT family protein n=1 Tax=Fibrella rubiginis TaxID=2817060 RepID=A0A939GA40_9BACT|nr:porin family protein [Fibrella rubiginis]MBO0935262.1 PorT family protein [Fibrella rubiginis]
MKISLLYSLLTGLLVSLSLSAQPRFGIRASVQNCFLTYPTVQTGTSFGTRIGYDVGVVLEWPLSTSWAIQPSLLLSSKGSTFAGTVSYGTTGVVFAANNTVFRPLYLQLPALLVYRFPVTPRFKLLVGAGPYGAIGVGGTMLRDVLYQNFEVAITYGPKGTGTQFRRYDYGVSALAGIEVGKCNFTLNLNEGLANTTSFIVSTDIRNRTIGFSAGFLVGAGSETKRLSTTTNSNSPAQCPASSSRLRQTRSPMLRLVSNKRVW